MADKVIVTQFLKWQLFTQKLKLQVEIGEIGWNISAH
jgi:hypothetical protein